MIHPTTHGPAFLRSRDLFAGNLNVTNRTAHFTSKLFLDAGGVTLELLRCIRCGFSALALHQSRFADEMLFCPDIRLSIMSVLRMHMKRCFTARWSRPLSRPSEGVALVLAMPKYSIWMQSP